MTGDLHQGWFSAKYIISFFFHSKEEVKHFSDSDSKKEERCDLTLSSLSLDMPSAVNYDQTKIPCIPSHYVQVIEEPMEYHDCKELAKKIVSSVSNCGSSSVEAYEKTITKHGDKMFYKFHKRLGRCPEQVLRYVKCS